MSTPRRVLFLCTGNSCRSQMAEGFARALHGDTFQAYSAGTEPKQAVDPRAVAVMAEAGVDITSQRTKALTEVLESLSRSGEALDLVVTVCGHAHETCPIFPGDTKVVHVGFNDPPTLAEEASNETEALAHYRRVRDEIRDSIKELPTLVGSPQKVNKGDSA
jgi:arsenate reductase (thioredoxin)